ncbi:family 43 glycosylhydrolase [Aquipuribacter hungaricus]|uniref:Family 43 glycosylhydrolase n=1 Tax=Aquipuribacter hungaricus TaxID=545624 RepID=A0ABV7WE14_9MICO
MAHATTHVHAKVMGVLLAIGLLTPATAAVAAPGGPALGTPAPAPVIEPVIDANAPDPDVLLVDGVYHAYATNSGGENVQHFTSTDLETWTDEGDVAPTLGDWVAEGCSFGPGGVTDRCIWAPEVSEVEGGYALYYTARDSLAPRQCIGVSLSDSPDGPFLPVGTDPLVCPDGARGTVDLGGAIDAGTYTEDGRLYLLWKADGNCCPDKTAIIYLQELSLDGTTLTGDPVELIRRDLPYEGAVVEAPTLLEVDGTYYLFYSANDFGGGGYRTSYATSDSLTGPWTKATTELMTTDRFSGDVRGPGGQDIVVNPDGGYSIVFHGWDPTYSYRAVYTSELVFVDGVPSVVEASERYQAEDGVVVDARVVGDTAASGGAKVGGMDFATSSVTVTVDAEQAGPAVIGIRYTNGTEGPGGRLTATDSLTVNGRDAGLVTFAHTTWGNWQTLEQQVRLREGLNTITLTRVSGFAEIDAVDLYEGRRLAPVNSPPSDPTTAVRYEAEAGVISNARVRGDGSASGGAVVGGLDFDDSSVTFTVVADKGGPATLGIRMSNGSERGGWPIESTQDVTVNGRPAGTVTYPFTRWGNWTTVEHTVLLRKGVNTVTLTHDTFFAELDAVDVY